MMSLLEAISPTARGLLSRISGGGSVKFLTKERSHGKHRTHVMNTNGAPVCGGGNSARNTQWQEVFTDPDCNRCLIIIERRNRNQTNKMNTLQEIEKLAQTFSEEHTALSAIVADIEAEHDATKRKYITALRKVVGRAKEAKARLSTAVESAPALFVKPRTQIFHGIKVGFVKGKGKLEIEDEDVTIARLKKLFAESAPGYLRIVEELNKEALALLPAADLKKLGVTVTDTGDTVVVKPVDGAVEKIVTALLKDSDEKQTT
jgi:hypothetical protein